jgi:hypothetical protein
MICSPSSARATNNAANALTSWNASALTYDANGNLKTDAVHNFTYFWNARNELVEITKRGRSRSSRTIPSAGASRRR